MAMEKDPLYQLGTEDYQVVVFPKYEAKAGSSSRGGALFMALLLAVIAFLGYTRPVLGAVLAILGSAVYAYGWYPAWRLRHIPGPEPKWLVGNLAEYRSLMPHIALKLWSDKYGPVVKYCIGHTPAVAVCDADLVKEVTIKQFKNFHDRMRNPLLPPRAELGLVFSRGTYWEGVRNNAMPLFHSQRLAKYGPQINIEAEKLIKRLEDVPKGEFLPISVWIKQMTLDVIGSTVFGQEFAAQRDSSSGLGAAVNNLVSFDKLPLSILVAFFVPELAPIVWAAMLRIPSTSEHQMSKLREVALEHCMKTLQNRKHDADADNMFDFMTMLMRSKNKETGQSLSDDETTTQAFDMIGAGFDTTANALAFAVHLIAQHPGVEARLLQEIDAFGDRLPTFEDLSDFPYVEAVFKETMRVHPPIANFSREAINPTTIAGYHIPKGVSVVTGTYALHMNPEHFANPTKFQPERFMPESEENKRRHPYAYVPFGAGPRMCLGYKFALEEAKLTLIRVYKRFTFRLKPGTEGPLKIRSALINRPLNPVMVSVHPR
eukprot:jgi/Chlat1/5055/Chrsp33S04999